MRPPTALLLGSLLLGACSHEPTLADAVAGHYELVSVNGQPLPYFNPPSLGFIVAPIVVGDLVLREDGTYAFGVSGFVEGSWSLAGSELQLGHLSGSGGPATATAGGDSVTVHMPGTESSGLAIGGAPTLHFVFRRPLTGAPVVTSGTFTLATINGRGEPLTAYDTTIEGMHHVGRVLFDSLLFMDGAFFRRHRAETDMRNDDVATTSSNEFNGWGSYRGRPDSLVLLSYFLPTGQVGMTDRVAYEQGQLVRRRFLITGTYVERFTRR